MKLKTTQLRKTLMASALAVAGVFSANSQTLQWANGLGGSLMEQGNSMAIDSLGNTYVTGGFQGTVDFDPSNASFTLTSAGQSDIFIAKYSSSGSLIWAKSFGNSDGDIGVDIKLDNNGSFYLTGTFTGEVDFDPSASTANLTSIAFNDVFFAKYDTAGNYIWANMIGGAPIEISSLIVDQSGDILLAGSFNDIIDFDPSTAVNNLSSYNQADMFIARYTSAGNYIWAKNVSGIYMDVVTAIDVDNLGYIYITGYFSETIYFDPNGINTLTANGGEDILLAKYSPSGNLIWAKNMGGTEYDWGMDLKVKDGFIYLTGSYEYEADLDPLAADSSSILKGDYWDVFIAKYDTAGNYIWAKGFGGTDADDPKSIFVDMYSNIYITGFFRETVDFDPSSGVDEHTSEGYQDIFFTKFDSDGNYLWTKTMGGNTWSWMEQGNCIQRNNNGNIQVLGTYEESISYDITPIANSNGDHDVFLLNVCDEIPAPLILTSNPTICSGENALLQANGYGTINWYDAPSGGNLVGSGHSFTTANLTDTTVFYAEANACAISQTRTPVTVMVKPLPSVSLDFSSFSDLCENSSNVNLTGETPTGGVYSGTGVNGNTFDLATAGIGSHTITYTYTSSDNCTNSASEVITVHELPTVTVDFSIIGNLCENDRSITLSGGLPSGGTYNGNGVSANDFDPAAAGVGNHSLTYTFTDEFGCSSSASGNVSVLTIPFVLWDVQMPTLCLNNVVVLLSGGMPSGGTYNGPGVINDEFYPSEGIGTHTIGYTFIDGNGCSNTATNEITVNPLPMVELNLQNLSPLCINSQSITLNQGTPAGGAYSGPGITGNTFDPAAAGVGVHKIEYTYMEIDVCVNTVSDEINVDLCDNIEKTANNSGISIYPNPTLGNITIETNKIGRIIVYNALGQNVFTKEIFFGKNEINLNFLYPGVYFIKSSEDQTINYKLIKQ